MDEKWLKQVQQLAADKGISVDDLLEHLKKIEEKGELGLSHLKSHMTGKIQTQEDARTLFRMAAQEAELSSSDEYIEVFPNLGEQSIKTLRKTFKSLRIETDRLQKRNIMITPELWHTLVENEKELVSSLFLKKSIDYKSGQILFSQIFKLNNLENLDQTVSHRKNCDAVILRTIQFDFLNSSKNYENKKIKKFNKRNLEKYSQNLDLFFNSVNGKYFNDIYNIADNCLDFSIHEYYLPYGFSEEGLEKAVLLMRYDHCSETHKNSSLLKYYSKLFQPKLSEPHFHFNEGFGQIYKLLTKKGNNNFGSGFAIGVPELCAYLDKLKELSTLPDEERKFWESNDFGMPFLKFLNDDQIAFDNQKTDQNGGEFSDKKNLERNIEEKEHKNETSSEVEEDKKQDKKHSTMLSKLDETLSQLYLASVLGETSIELQSAFDFFNIMSGVPISYIDNYEIIDDYKDDRFKNDSDFRR